MKFKTLVVILFVVAASVAQAADSATIYKGLVEIGLAKKTDFLPVLTPNGPKGLGQIYVDERVWVTMDLDEKNDAVKFFSVYRNDKVGLMQVTLYDYGSGKELASYGAFQEVKIKTP
jgi:hypothetical protein